jgi:hypothetical protein
MRQRQLHKSRDNLAHIVQKLVLGILQQLQILHRVRPELGERIRVDGSVGVGIGYGRGRGGGIGIGIGIGIQGPGDCGGSLHPLGYGHLLWCAGDRARGRYLLPALRLPVLWVWLLLLLVLLLLSLRLLLLLKLVLMLLLLPHVDLSLSFLCTSSQLRFVHSRTRRHPYRRDHRGRCHRGHWWLYTSPYTRHRWNSHRRRIHRHMVRRHRIRHHRIHRRRIHRHRIRDARRPYDAREPVPARKSRTRHHRRRRHLWWGRGWLRRRYHSLWRNHRYRPHHLALPSIPSFARAIHADAIIPSITLQVHGLLWVLRLAQLLLAPCDCLGKGNGELVVQLVDALCLFTVHWIRRRVHCGQWYGVDEL